MISKLGYQIIVNEFNFDWVPHNSDLVPNEAKLSK